MLKILLVDDDKLEQKVMLKAAVQVVDDKSANRRNCSTSSCDFAKSGLLIADNKSFL